MQVVGIDLGTTYSAIAIIGSTGKPEIIPNREGERITPSVVLFQDDLTLVGSMAKRSTLTSPNDVVQFVKRKIGDPSWRFTSSSGTQYSPEQVSAIILKRLKEDAELALGVQITDAVITVPAYFDDARRKATQDAGVIAGLNVRRVLNEPTAAALAYGLESHFNGTVLVYDLGGGTFDVTVMRVHDGEFDVVGTDGDRNLGGFDWDNELMSYINDEIQKQGGPDFLSDDVKTEELRDKAELAKRSLTTLPEAKVFFSADGKTFTVTVTRDTFEHLTAGLLGRTKDITALVLEDACLEWEEIDRLLLVGGSTRMPMVQELMKQISRKEPERSINPDEVVALGAAIQAYLTTDGVDTHGQSVLEGAPEAGLRVLDVTALGLGVIAHDEHDVEKNFVLVNRNSKIPASGRDQFVTKYDNQATVLVRITEGDDSDSNYVKVVGSGEFSLPPYPRGAEIEIRIAYDIDAIVHAEVFDGKTLKKLGDMEIDRTSNLSDEQVAIARSHMASLEVN